MKERYGINLFPLTLTSDIFKSYILRFHMECI